MNKNLFFNPLFIVGALMSPLYAQESFTNNPEVLEISGSSGIDPVYSSPTSLSSEELYVYDDQMYTTNWEGESFAPSSTPHVLRKVSTVFEYFAQQSFRDARGKFSYANAYLTLPLVNPQNYAFRGWHLDLSLNLRATFFDVSGENLVDEKDLYTTGAIASVFYNIDEKARLTFGVTPQFSSDLNNLSSSNFYFGIFTAFTYKASDKIRITMGMSYMPDYYRHDLWPLINVSWEVAPKWDLRVQSQRLGVIRRVGSKGSFEWGPFIQWNHFLWSVDRQNRTDLLRMESFVFGVQAQYNSQLQSGKNLRVYADLGLNFDQEIRFEDKDNAALLDRYKADAGLYTRLGVEFSF